MKYKEYSPLVLRIGIGIVFLWFGLTNIFNPQTLIGYLPKFVQTLPIEPLSILLITGIFEVVFAIFLIIGLFTRLSSLLLFLHLVIVIIGIGYNDVAVRDFGLALATLAIFLHGPAKWCLDNRRKK